MKPYQWLIIFVILIVAVLSSYYFFFVQQTNDQTDSITSQKPNSSTTAATPSITTSPKEENYLYEPVEEFEERITLKPFGIYITPESSPVQPERFAGYHTGVDVEFTDREDKTPVYAIADGTVITSQTVSGYGGLTVIRHEIDGVNIDTIYAHLDPSSLPRKGSEVAAGEVIGHLGEGNTEETDFERKHLHFAMHKDNELDLRGYVQTEAELSDWYNPLSYF